MNWYREIDVVLKKDETIEQVMIDMMEAADAKITWALVNEAGPSGHPNVLIIGTQGEIEQFCGYMFELGEL